MSGCLNKLYKQPGICPVDVRATWRRLFAKIVLTVTGLEANMVCQDDLMCAGLKAGIDGAIHGVQALRDEKLSIEEWVFLLVDAKNAFNEINRVGILWAV